jgi:hypothetical protein
MPTISMIESYRVAGQKPSHYSRNRYISCSQEEMCMIAEQGPCIARRGTSQQQIAESLKKSVPITTVAKDHSLFDPSDDYMVQRPWSVYS